MSNPASRPSSPRPPSGERKPESSAEPDAERTGERKRPEGAEESGTLEEDSLRDDALQDDFVQMKSLQSLQRLRDRVEHAVREMERLHEENRALQQRLQALEARPLLDVEGTVVTFDEDPEQLRRTIQGFITSIDRYLEQENPPS